MTQAYRLSTALGILLFVEAVGGLFAPHLYRDAPVWTAQARGVNLVDLVVGLPALAVSLLMSVRGSLRARVVWAGVLIPLYILSAWWLLRRRAWGYLLAGCLLVLDTLLSLSVISSTIFQYITDRSISLAVVPMFSIIAVISAVLVITYLHSLQDASR